MMTDSTMQSLYEMAGGAATLRALVNAFYERVQNDTVLRPLFPDDFTEIREKQYLFLTQFFGGPALYSQQHGAPMLKARHMRFPVHVKHAQAWLSCMSEAMNEIGLHGPLRDVMFDRLTRAAYHMVNSNEDGSPLHGPNTLYIDGKH